MKTRQILFYSVLFLLVFCHVSDIRANDYPMMENMLFRFFPTLDTIDLSCSIKTNNNQIRPVLFFQGTAIDSGDDSDSTYSEKNYSFEEFNMGEYKCNAETAEATISIKFLPIRKKMNNKGIIEMAISINAMERSTSVEFEGTKENVDFLCKKDNISMKLNWSNKTPKIKSQGFIKHIAEVNRLTCYANESPILEFEVDYKDVVPKIHTFSVHIMKTPVGPWIRTTCKPIDILKNEALLGEIFVGLYDGHNLTRFTNGTMVAFGKKLSSYTFFSCHYSNKFGYDVVGFVLDLADFDYAMIKSKLDSGAAGEISFSFEMLEKSFYINNMRNPSNRDSISCHSNYKPMPLGPVIIYENHQFDTLYSDMWLENEITCNNVFGRLASLTFVRKGLRPIITKLSLEVNGYKTKIDCHAFARLFQYKISLFWGSERKMKETKNGPLVFESDYTSDYWKCVVETITGKDEVIMYTQRQHFNDAPTSRFEYDHNFEARIEPDSINPGWFVQNYVNSSGDLSEGYFCIKNPEYDPNYSDHSVQMNLQDPALNNRKKKRLACYNREVSGYSFNFVRDKMKLT